MGAALTQHPEMYRAVVSGVGIYDSLRFELTDNGVFNVTELGTVSDPAQLRALYAYSPYHRVRDGVAYPAVLLTTGANDPRVDPYNSRKMTARLQAATSSDRPILLRAADDVGHGMGSPLAAVIDEAADSYAFLMHELAMRYIE
jgi:prolyl oligopeptidase